MTRGIDLTIRGGRVVTQTGVVEMDVHVAEGSIAALGTLDVPAGTTLDAGGLYVLPGFVDVHVHFMDPGDTAREDFPAGSAAAAVAGVTTVLEHSHARPVRNVQEFEEKARYLAGRSVIDFGLAAHLNPDDPKSILDVWQRGAAFVKVFTCTTHGIKGTDAGTLFQALQSHSQVGVTFLVHAEDEALTSSFEVQLRAAGRRDGAVIPEWRTLLGEQVAVHMVADVAQATGARVVIAHCSHASIVDSISAHRTAGASIRAETCPQYLYLYEKEVMEPGPLRKFTPPARAKTPDDLEAMWSRLRDGRISYVASDHAPSTRSQKQAGSIWDVHFGLPGIDPTSLLLLDAVARGHLSLLRLADVYSRTPAITYGLYPKKGALAPGSDADFVLVDLESERILRDEQVLSKAGWTPYAGRQIRGAVVATYLRGRRVAEGGQRVAPQGTGQFIPGPGALTTSLRQFFVNQ
jgi:dihydroorotase